MTCGQSSRANLSQHDWNASSAKRARFASTAVD
jgi:hypothetical protein